MGGMELLSTAAAPRKIGLNGMGERKRTAIFGLIRNVYGHERAGGSYTLYVERRADTFVKLPGSRENGTTTSQYGILSIEKHWYTDFHLYTSTAILAGIIKTNCAHMCAITVYITIVPNSRFSIARKFTGLLIIRRICVLIV